MEGWSVCVCVCVWVCVCVCGCRCVYASTWRCDVCTPTLTCFLHVKFSFLCLHVSVLCLCLYVWGQRWQIWAFRARFGTRLLWRIAFSLLIFHTGAVLWAVSSPTCPPPHAHTRARAENLQSLFFFLFFFFLSSNGSFMLHCAYRFQRENGVHLKERRWKRFNDL